MSYDVQGFDLEENQGLNEDLMHILKEKQLIIEKQQL